MGIHEKSFIGGMRMPDSYVFASGNANKLAELRNILNIPGIFIESLQETSFHGEIVESGNTFCENAWIKANTVYEVLKRPVIAEDSGLEVNVLHGNPGIYSARYAGTHGDHQANNHLLLTNMRGISNRTAFFTSAVAIRMKDRRYTFFGRVRGQIGYASKGSGGFGYDPIFIPDGFDRTFGELPQHIKDALSHRARALRYFRTLLRATA